MCSTIIIIFPHSANQIIVFRGRCCCCCGPCLIKLPNVCLPYHINFVSFHCSDLWEQKPLLIKRHQANYNEGWFSTKEFDDILRQVPQNLLSDNIFFCAFTENIKNQNHINLNFELFIYAT